MDKITLEQVGYFITYLVALITGIAFILNKAKVWITKSLKDEFTPINEKIDGLQTDIKQVDMNACKNYLVRTLGDIEKDKSLDEIEIERLWEQYEHYQKIGGNSYVTRKVENLKKGGKL